MKQKIKIMKQRPQLSDEEIRSYMDFDRIVANRNLIVNKPKFHHWKWIVPTIAFIGIGAWLILTPLEKEEVRANANVEENSEPGVDNTPGSTPSNEVAATPAKDETAEDNTPVKKSSPPARQSDDDDKSEDKSAEKKSAEDIYTQAEPADGYSALYTYFNSNLIYPSEAIKDSVQGVQTVSFIINEEGKPEKIIIRQSLGEPFEKEARRLIENMPPWKPATLNGKPVPSQMSVPLTFQFEKVKVNR